MLLIAIILELKIGQVNSAHTCFLFKALKTKWLYQHSNKEIQFSKIPLEEAAPKITELLTKTVLYPQKD